MPHYASLTAATLTAVSLSFLLPPQQANAASIFTGSSVGTFGKPTVNPETDPDALFSIENSGPQSETFVLGEADTGSMPNKLTFSGTNFSTNADQPFAIGDLSYFNGQTFIGTNVSSVPIDITLAFNQPIQAQRQFGYRFDFDLTPNTDTSNADHLVIAEAPVPQTIVTEDTRYRIELLGFSQDNGATFGQSFETPEDMLVNSTLFAQLKLATIDRDINPPGPTEVPEPHTFAGLLLLGSVMLLRKPSDPKNVRRS
ncbi:MAG: choice-of-anchor K domain-containing protein [Cyanobacteria bacterium J06598_3]